MELTLSEIFKNQQRFKENIIDYFADEYKKSMRSLDGIHSESKIIMAEKEKMQKKFNRTKAMESVKKYFLKHEKDKRPFYVLWDTESQEAIVKQLTDI